MRKTRLFPTLVLYGASLTGGAVATVATVALTISGCKDEGANDMARYPDIGIAPRDMAHGYVDIGIPFVDMEHGD